MPVWLHHIIVDTYDLPGLAWSWTQALGWKVLSEREREIVIGAGENAPADRWFMPVTDPKMVKTACASTSPAARRTATRRLSALRPGARRVDAGQAGAESGVVLAGPEGSEFCVIRPRETLTRSGSAPAGAGRPLSAA